MNFDQMLLQIKGKKIITNCTSMPFIFIHAHVPVGHSTNPLFALNSVQKFKMLCLHSGISGTTFRLIILYFHLSEFLEKLPYTCKNSDLQSNWKKIMTSFYHVKREYGDLSEEMLFVCIRLTLFYQFFFFIKIMDWLEIMIQ